MTVGYHDYGDGDKIWGYNEGICGSISSDMIGKNRIDIIGAWSDGHVSVTCFGRDSDGDLVAIKPPSYEGFTSTKIISYIVANGTTYPLRSHVGSFFSSSYGCTDDTNLINYIKSNVGKTISITLMEA